MDTDAEQTHHGFDQQFAGPGRTPPAVILRRPAHNGVQALQIIFAELIVAVVGSTVVQSRFAIAAKLVDDAADRGVVHVQHLRRLPRRASADHIKDHEIPQSGSSVPVTSQPLGQPILDTHPNVQDNLVHGNSFRSQDRVLRALMGEFPFSIPAAPLRAADSRTVI